MKTFAKILSVVLALAAGTILADPVSLGGSGTGAGPMKRGYFLKPPQYATQGTMALYVDGTNGSDTNACTGTTTNACATIQGAVDKIPFQIAHPVTVDIAAGNYTGFRFTNHMMQPATIAAGAYFLMRGAAHANTTPATGTATGTVTSVTTDTIGYHVVSDSGQTWTVNDSNIQGRFLTLTGGTGSGQILPIVSNTATSVTIAGTFSPAPVAGTTYAITSPSTIINTATSQPVTSLGGSTVSRGIILSELWEQRFSPLTYSFQDIDVTGAFTSVNLLAAYGITFTRLRATTTASIVFQQNFASQATLTASIFLAGSTSTALNIGDDSGDFSNTTLTNVYARSGNTLATGATVLIARSTNILTFSGVQLENTTTTGNVFAAFGMKSWTSVGKARFLCSAGVSTNVGANIASTTNFPIGAAKSVDFNGTISIETCGTGVRLNGIGTTATFASTTTFLSNTTALNVTGGGKAAFLSVPAFTTNGTDISVDGVTASRAVFTALVPNSIVDLSYLSAVYLQP